MTAMRCPYCRGAGRLAGVGARGCWCEDIGACPECFGNGWVDTTRRWFRAWRRSPAETPIQKVAKIAKELGAFIFVCGIVVLVFDGVRLADRILAPSREPNWLLNAEPNGDDLARARAIVAAARNEVRALPQAEKPDADREDATLTLSISEGLSTVYDAARRDRAISPDALDRAEDIQYFAARAAWRRTCDAPDDCHREFDEGDYYAGLIAYTARAFAAARGSGETAREKSLLSRLWDWL